MNIPSAILEVLRNNREKEMTRLNLAKSRCIPPNTSEAKGKKARKSALLASESRVYRNPSCSPPSSLDRATRLQHEDDQNMIATRRESELEVRLLVMVMTIVRPWTRPKARRRQNTVNVIRCHLETPKAIGQQRPNIKHLCHGIDKAVITAQTMRPVNLGHRDTVKVASQDNRHHRLRHLGRNKDMTTAGTETGLILAVMATVAQ